MTELATVAERLLRIGQVVRVSLLDDEKVSEIGLAPAGFLREHNSLLEDLSSKHLAVAWPTEGGALLPLEIGQSIALRIPYDLGLLQLVSTIAGTEPEPVPLLIINRAGHWSRIQRRNHARVDVNIIPQEARIFPSRGQLAQTAQLDSTDLIVERLKTGVIEGEAFGAIITNLSAGGMLLASKRPAEPGHIVKIKFALDAIGVEIEALSNVVWAEKSRFKRLYICKAGCQFIGLSRKEQELIAKFVFARQTELRRYRLPWWRS